LSAIVLLWNQGGTADDAFALEIRAKAFLIDERLTIKGGGRGW